MCKRDPRLWAENDKSFGMQIRVSFRRRPEMAFSHASSVRSRKRVCPATANVRNVRNPRVQKGRPSCWPPIGVDPRVPPRPRFASDDRSQKYVAGLDARASHVATLRSRYLDLRRRARQHVSKSLCIRQISNVRARVSDGEKKNTWNRSVENGKIAHIYETKRLSKGQTKSLWCKREGGIANPRAVVDTETLILHVRRDECKSFALKHSGAKPRTIRVGLNATNKLKGLKNRLKVGLSLAGRRCNIWCRTASRRG